MALLQSCTSRAGLLLLWPGLTISCENCDRTVGVLSWLVSVCVSFLVFML